MADVSITDPIYPGMDAIRYIEMPRPIIWYDGDEYKNPQPGYLIQSFRSTGGMLVFLVEEVPSGEIICLNLDDHKIRFTDR